MDRTESSIASSDEQFYLDRLPVSPSPIPSPLSQSLFPEQSSRPLQPAADMGNA